MDGSAKVQSKINSVVIGGGFGGIAIALRLRALGHQVTLLEKLSCLGAVSYTHLTLPTKA